MDLRAGAGYAGGENIRIHNTKNGQSDLSKHGFVPLYDFSIGPINIADVYSQADYTLGKGLRLGLLFTYTGDTYESQGVGTRGNTLFGGAFIGFNFVTLYAYTDLLHKPAGTLYYFRVAPALFKSKKNAFYLILEAEHMNRGYVDYYFGIKANEASVILPAYTGERTTNASGAFLLDFMLSKRLEFLTWISEKFYGPGVTRSPTVGFRHAYSAGGGMVFRFLGQPSKY